MKLPAEQFARLTELLGKGQNLTAEETTEKAGLESLIVAQDDETPPADPPASDPEPAPAPVEDEEETEETEDETDPGEEEEGALDPQAFEKLTMGAKFKALLTSRAALVTALSAAKAKLTTLATQLTAATARATAAEASLAQARTDLAASQARVATLEAEAKALHSAVTDELAGLGVDRNEAPAADAEGKGGPVEAAYEDFRSARTPEEKAAAHRRLKAAQAKGKTPAASMN